MSPQNDKVTLGLLVYDYIRERKLSLIWVQFWDNYSQYRNHSDNHYIVIHLSLGHSKTSNNWKPLWIVSILNRLSGPLFLNISMTSPSQRYYLILKQIEIPCNTWGIAWAFKWLKLKIEKLTFNFNLWI